MERTTPTCMSELDVLQEWYWDNDQTELIVAATFPARVLAMAKDMKPTQGKIMPFQRKIPKPNGILPKIWVGDMVLYPETHRYLFVNVADGTAEIIGGDSTNHAFKISIKGAIGSACFSVCYKYLPDAMAPYGSNACVVTRDNLPVVLMLGDFKVGDTIKACEVDKLPLRAPESVLEISDLDNPWRSGYTQPTNLNEHASNNTSFLTGNIESLPMCAEPSSARVARALERTKTHVRALKKSGAISTTLDTAFCFSGKTSIGTTQHGFYLPVGNELEVAFFSDGQLKEDRMRRHRDALSAVQAKHEEGKTMEHATTMTTTKEAQQANAPTQQPAPTRRNIKLVARESKSSVTLERNAYTCWAFDGQTLTYEHRNYRKPASANKYGKDYARWLGGSSAIFSGCEPYADDLIQRLEHFCAMS